MYSTLIFIYLCVWGTSRLECISSAPQNEYKTATEVMNELFHEDNYDKRLRPYYKGPQLNITIDMAVVHLGKVREIDMDFSLDAFFRQYWHDPRLSHSLEEGIILTGAHRNAIWLPDTFFLNIKTAKFHNVPAENSRVTIRPNGDIKWSTRITMTASCQLDLRDYPLDEQSCNLTLLSYAYPLPFVDYFWKARDKEGIVILNDEMNEYTLKSTKTRKANVQYGTRGSSRQWTHLWAIFTFQRRTGYSFLQIYAPTVLIVMLSWLTFWISKDAVPARVALGVTTVLTIVTLMGSFRSSVPKVSYIKALDLFFILSFFFVFGAVMEYILVLLHSERKRKGQKKESNDDIRMTELPLCDDNGRTESWVNIPGRQNGDENDSETLQSIRKRSDHRSPIRTTKELVKFAFIENEANIIDRISRVMFPVTYLAFNIVYWFYYSFAIFNGN